MNKIFLIQTRLVAVYRSPYTAIFSCRQRLRDRGSIPRRTSLSLFPYVTWIVISDSSTTTASVFSIPLNERNSGTSSSVPPAGLELVMCLSVFQVQCNALVLHKLQPVPQSPGNMVEYLLTTQFFVTYRLQPHLGNLKLVNNMYSGSTFLVDFQYRNENLFRYTK